MPLISTMSLCTYLTTSVQRFMQLKQQYTPVDGRKNTASCCKSLCVSHAMLKAFTYSLITDIPQTLDLPLVFFIEMSKEQWLSTCVFNYTIWWCAPNSASCLTPTTIIIIIAIQRRLSIYNSTISTLYCIYFTYFNNKTLSYGNTPNKYRRKSL